MVGARVTTESRWRSAASRSLAGSLIASVLSQLFLIVSGVLVARSLGPEDRGYLALLVVASGVCILIGTMGLPLAATYYIARERSKARQIAASLLRTSVFQVIGTLALQTAVVAALVMHEPGRVKAAALISLAMVPGILAFAFGTAFLQGQQRFAAFNVLRILPTALYVGAVVIVVLLDSADLVPIMTIWAAANFVCGFLALGIAVRGLPTEQPDGPPPARSQMARFGLKSLFGSISPIDTLRLDQAVVGLLLTPVALGFYVVAQALTNLPRIVAYSIGVVAYPQVASHKDPAAARRALWKYFFLGVTISALVVGALWIAAGQIVTVFFGSEFDEATSIARILLVGSLFMAARRVLTDGVNGLGHPGLGTIAEVASWVLLVPAVALLLPFGVEGVALALTVAWGGSLLLLLVLVGVGEARLSSSWRWGRNLVQRLALRPPPVTGPQLTGLAVAVAAVLAAGIAVALLPSQWALAAIAVLSAGLFVAFGRSALAQKTHSLRVRLATARSSPEDVDEASSRWADAELRVARRLYYLGLLFLGLLTVRAGGQVTYSDVLFLFSFLLACAELAVVRRRVSMTVPFLLLLGMAMFSFGGLLSTFYSYAPLNSAAVLARLIFLTVFWFWLGTVVLRSREHVIRASSFWVASVAICGGAAVLQVLSGDVVPWTGTVQFGRATGFTTHPNDLGGLAAVAFVPAVMLAARRSLAAPQRVFSWLLLLFVAAGLVLSGSVGALLAAAAAIFVWLAFQRSSVQSLPVFGALAVCVIGVVTVQGMRGAPTPLERFDIVTNPSESAGGGSGSLDARITTYGVAAAEIKKNPFVGVGLDLVSITRPFGIVSYEYDVHNVIIGSWYKAGLFGLAGMLIAFFAIFRVGWMAILASRSEAEQAAAVALVGAVVAFVVFAMSAPVLFSRFGWISAALLLAFRAVQRESRVARVSWNEADLRGMSLAPARP